MPWSWRAGASTSGRTTTSEFFLPLQRSKRVSWEAKPQRLREVVEACARSRSYFESAARALMCTVELEDKLARRGRVLCSVKVERILSGPWDSSSAEIEELRAIPHGEYLEHLRRNPPLLLAFETVEGEPLYVVDKGCTKVAVARERGLDAIPAEVYSPPYRLPAGMSLELRSLERGRILIAGGSPPEVLLPVRGEGAEGLQALLELRGLKVAGCEA